MVFKRFHNVEIITSNEPYKIKTILVIVGAFIVITSFLLNLLSLNTVIERELEISKNSFNFVVAPLTIRLYLFALALISIFQVKDKKNYLSHKNLMVLTFIMIIVSTVETISYGQLNLYKTIFLSFYLAVGIAVVYV
ncbi:MAG: hypothetical protein N3E37_04415, partial [Candidatus Micrarchaeota archaeon]|nr:hypothetical protein [Candidatus Micrarchaeota archaeon]